MVSTAKSGLKRSLGKERKIFINGDTSINQ